MGLLPNALVFRELYGDEGVVEWAKKWGSGRNHRPVLGYRPICFKPVKYTDHRSKLQRTKLRYFNLTGDYFGTGVIAANFFLHKGYKSFAYYGLTDTVWGRERGEGFKKIVSNKGV